MSNFLYSSEHSQNLSKDLRWPDSQQVSSIEKTLTNVLMPWFIDWIACDELEVTVQGVVASEFKLSGSGFKKWYEIKTIYERAAFFGFAEIGEVAIERALPIASPNLISPKSKILPNLASKAFDALCIEFNRVLNCSSFEHKDCLPPQDMFEPWSGAVLFEVTSNAIKYCLVLNSEIVNFLCEPRKKNAKVLSSKPELSSLSNAINAKKIGLKVELVGCELDINTLQNLQIGDVIRLPHRLDEAVVLKTENNDVFSSGYLGCIKTKKAIEIVVNDVLPYKLKEDSNVEHK